MVATYMLILNRYLLFAALFTLTMMFTVHIEDVLTGMCQQRLFSFFLSSHTYDFLFNLKRSLYKHIFFGNDGNSFRNETKWVGEGMKQCMGTVLSCYDIQLDETILA